MISEAKSMLRIKTNALFVGEDHFRLAVVLEALYGASTSLILCAAHWASDQNEMTINLEAIGINRTSPNLHTELWQVKIHATLESRDSRTTKAVKFYWLKPTSAEGTPFLSLDGVSQCQVNQVFEEISTLTLIPI